MALTLRDVVESRVSQRASGVRSDRSGIRDGSDAPRERFSLAEADTRADLASQARASANARSDTARRDAARTSSRADEARPARAEDAARSKPVRPDAVRPNSTKAETTTAATTEPGADPVRSSAEGAGVVKQPAAGSDDGATESTALVSADTPDQPATPPVASGKPAGIDRGGRPGAPSKGVAQPPAPTETDPALAGQAEVQGAETGGAEPQKSASKGESEEAAGSKVEASTSAAAMPMLAAFAAPPPSAPPPDASHAARQAAGGDGGSEIEGAAATANAAPGDAAGKGPARSATAARPGFEAALAEAVPQGAEDAAASVAALNAGAAVPDKPAAGVAGSSDTTATAAAQPQAQASPATPPVPLGAVPMTIGLRALGASNRFEIRLDPKELGRIDVSIDIDKDNGTVGARLVVDRPETLALLQRDASSLQQALAQTGLDPSAGVTLSLRGGEGESSRDGREPGAGAQSRNDGQADRSGANGGTDQAVNKLVPLHALRGFGRVDIRI